MSTILIPVRKQSERCPEKCSKPFYGEKSLTEICVEKYAGRNDVILAAHEDEFKDIADQYGVGFLKRSLRSAESNKIEEIIDYVPELPGETICWVNVCTPFMKAETVDRAIKAFAQSDASTLLPVMETNEIIFGHDHMPVNRDAHIFDSKVREMLYTISCGFLIYTKKTFVEKKRYFDEYLPGDPMLFTVSHKESLDIDTQEQFDIVQAYYAKAMQDKA